MPVNLNQEPRPKPAIELKSGSVTVPVLKLMSTDLKTVAAQLSQKISQAPDFFHNAPIIIDLHEIAAAGQLPELSRIIDALRKESLIPIGVRGGNESVNAAASKIQLAVLPDNGPEYRTITTTRPATTASAAAAASSRLITQPVRSGQRIYAAGDLIILSQVSAGAEIIADGNIHVYGSLRGRALAGVKGNLESRIFCHDLQAELVSVAGHYRISENLDPALRGVPVQIYLDGDSLIIEKL